MGRESGDVVCASLLTIFASERKGLCGHNYLGTNSFINALGEMLGALPYTRWVTC